MTPTILLKRDALRGLPADVRIIDIELARVEMLLLEINSSPCVEDLFLAYFDDRGLDDVLECLLGLIPHD